MKKIYEKPEIEITEFQIEENIALSGMQPLGASWIDIP